MIKTDIDATLEDRTADEPAYLPSASALWLYAVVVVVLLAGGITAYIVIGNGNSPAAAAGLSRPLGDQPALPIASAGSDLSNYNQASSSTSGLTAGSINLQDNAPAEQGSGNQASPIQSTAQAQDTGQSIDQSQPY